MKEGLSENALKVAQERYFMEGEDWESCTFRVANTIAEAEGQDRAKWAKIFHELMYEGSFVPGGRILRNAGRSRGSLFNCYVLPIGDSIEEIGSFYKESLQLWAEGGGIGCNFSSLRPNGDDILGKGGASSGLVSFLKASDNMSKVIESGGSRRAAALACVDVSHPEILDFIDAKLTHGELSHYNISVIVNNEFLEAVESDSDWTFKFKQKPYGTVKARAIWDKIIKNMVHMAEPGLLNSTNLYKNNSYYFDPIVSTNPCIAKGTLISTDNGLIPIEELNEKEFNVITDLRSINQQGSFKEKARCWYSGKKQVFKVILSNKQSIRLTDNHKVFIRENDVVKKIQVKDLKIRDRMIVQNTISPHYISDIDQDEFSNGLLVGWRLGDGWISEAYKGIKENRVSFGFIVGGEEDYAKEFITKKINEIIPMNKRSVSFLKSSGGAKSFELNTATEEVQVWFSKYGYDTKENNRVITKEVLRETHSFKRGFLAGLFSADGYCGEYKSKTNYSIGFSSSKKEIIDIIQIMLNEFGVSCTTGSAIVKCNLNNKYYNHYDLNIHNATNCSKFMREIGFHMSTKKENAGWKFPASKWKRKYEAEYWVKSIELDGEEDVYDINTDITHSLIANGILIANCGEVPLGEYNACDLGSLILPNFITGNVNTNWKKLAEAIRISVRFLDNVIDVNKYSMKQIDIKVHETRRIGLGILGLSDYLFMKQIRYGSEKCVVEIEKLMRFIRDHTYQASVDLAVEKGAFPKFDPIHFLKASFVRKLPVSLRMEIKEKGIRNVTCLSVAPNGTIALLYDYNGGIEPLFSKAFVRKDKIGSRYYIDKRYKEIISEGGEQPDWYVDSFDLQPKDHFEVQAIVQKYIDCAVSKTINLPSETTDKQLSKLLLEYVKDLKGVTVYRDGCRDGQVLTRISDDEARKVIDEEKVNSNLEAEDVQCSTGVCET